MQRRKVLLSLYRSSERYLLKIRSAFLVEIANFNKKVHTLVQMARHKAGCLFICVQVFGDTLREVDGSPLLHLYKPSLLAV